MKYFKILNKEMCHYGFQYQEGLNIDTEPFYNDICCIGGLTFSDVTNILRFCDYGDLIAEVEIPEDENLIILLGAKNKAHSIIIKNILPLWELDTFKMLIENGANIHANDDYALRMASKKGYLEIVQFLLEHGADAYANNANALLWAVNNGYTDIVRLLLNHITDVGFGCVLLYTAAEKGYVEIAKLLLENIVKTRDHVDRALCLASKFGHVEMVKLLLKYDADIYTNRNRPFSIASENKQTEIIKLLLKHIPDIQTRNDYASRYMTK